MMKKKILIAIAVIMCLVLAGGGYWYTHRELVSDIVEVPYGCNIVTISDNGIEVYWKMPEVTAGYEVYRSYDESKGYTLIADLPDFTGWSYFDKDFDESKREIFYKVRNYIYDEKGRKIYSFDSSIMKASYRTALKLNKTRKLYLASGFSEALEGYYGWKTAHDIVWDSDNAQVASVDADGNLVAISKGKCVITGSSKLADSSASIEVTVDREPTTMLAQYKSRFVETQEDMWMNPDAENSGDAVLMIVGDMMCMKPQQVDQGGETGDFNFNESYDLVKDIFATSDYTIGNLETMVDSAYPYYMDAATYKKKPNCNAPARILDALKYAGVDGVYTSNNHNCDTDIHGVIETINQLDRYEIGNTGLLNSPEDNRTMIATVNGIKVGFVSYATSYNSLEKYWDPEDVETYLNMYNREKAAKDVELLRSQGAEYVIVFMHWGIKNCIHHNEKQEQMAKELADMGVDYIAGSHPHVLQEYDEITAADGRVVPCVYSLGDFNSCLDQVPGNLESIILRLRLTRQKDGSISLTENSYIPCCIALDYGAKKYVTMPLNYDIVPDLDFKDYDFCRERIAERLGDKIPEYQWTK